LLLAAEYATLDTVKFLVGMKANIEAKNYDGLTALDLANRNNHTDVLHFLNNNETTSKTRENTLKKIEQQVEGTENDPKETAEKIREKKDDRAG